MHQEEKKNKETDKQKEVKLIKFSYLDFSYSNPIFVTGGSIFKKRIKTIVMVRLVKIKQDSDFIFHPSYGLSKMTIHSSIHLNY